MPTAPRSWDRPSPGNSLPSGLPTAGRTGVPSLEVERPAFRVAAPVARLGKLIPKHGSTGAGQEILVGLARAPLGSRVFLESRSPAGPAERIQALALPARVGAEVQEFRALVPALSSNSERVFLPVASFNGEEVWGEPVQYPDSAGEQARARMNPARAAAEDPPRGAEALPFPVMTLLAHVEAELPNATVFGQTPEGLRIAFYIADGHWRGPRIHARYRAEGGDWLLVRKDGVAIPDVRSTLETSDGALLYYELSGKIDLGPGGYERILGGAFPDLTPFSAVGRISTSSENWSWLNRLTLLGVGVVNLKIRRAHYDLYSVQCDPKALTG